MPDLSTSSAPLPPSPEAQPLSGVGELIRRGYELYKARLHAFLTVGGAMFVATAALSACVDLVSPDLVRMGSLGAIPLWLPLALFVAFVVYLILTQWIVFGYMQVARTSDARLSAGAALAQSGRRLPPFIWISIVTFFILCGVAIVFVGIPATILYLLGEVLVGKTAAIGVLSLYTIISVVIVACTFGIGGSFAGWLFLDDAQYRGVRAYAASYRLVQAVGLWRIVWRIIAFTIVLILFALILGTLLSVVFGASIGQILFSLFESLFLYPVFFGAVVELYKDSRAHARVDLPREIGWFRGAAILGFIVLVLLPLALLAFLLVSHGSLR